MDQQWWWLMNPRWRGLGRMNVSSCRPVGGCRVQFWIFRPYCTLGFVQVKALAVDAWKAAHSCCLVCLSFVASYLSALSMWLAFFTVEIWLAFFIVECQLSRSAMADGWFLPVHAVSSVGLCIIFLDRGQCAFLFGACWRRLLWACIYVFYSCDVAFLYIHLRGSLGHRRWPHNQFPPFFSFSTALWDLANSKPVH